MEKFYITVFLVGVIYAVITFLIGDLLNFAHLDTHIDTHMDHSGLGENLLVSPFKPITIVSFITVFGGVGFLGTYYNINKVITAIIAFALAAVISLVLYKLLLIPLYKMQNTSAVFQETLIGMKAVVISPIIENGFGTISYVVNGSIYNAPAQDINKKLIAQGESVMIYDIKNHIFYVQPLNETN